MYFGKKATISHQISLNGKTVDWADMWVYLGITLKSGKTFNCSITKQVKKFYRCVNRIEGRSNDTVMLRLIEAHCIPILTYGIETLHVANRNEQRQLRVAYNCLS